MKLDATQLQLQQQMQKLSALAKGGAAQATQNTSGNAAAANQFGDLLSNAISSVNHLQQQSSMAATQIETGDGGASLVKAVIASQKAGVAFEATVQVRNKVVSAYQDIMNMPI